MRDPTPDTHPDDLSSPVQAYLRGDAGAAERLSHLLLPTLRRETSRMLGEEHKDQDDVVQESVLAALGYLDRDREFTGDFPRLAITIARNRCRDLLRHRARFPHQDIAPLSEWIADTQASPLDHLEDAERRDLLQQALAALGDACRNLLRAMYIDEVETEVIRTRLGLGTVQAVYYRRTVCIDQMMGFLQGHRPGRSRDVRVGASAARPARGAE
jgi:RNA polymerase sigma factor (sigma-70 family)